MHATSPTLINLRTADHTQALQHKIDHKTKPLGSLGHLKVLARQNGIALTVVDCGVDQVSWQVRR